MNNFDKEYSRLMETVGGDNTEALKLIASVITSATELQAKLGSYNYPLEDWALAKLAKAAQSFGEVKEDCEFKCSSMDSEFSGVPGAVPQPEVPQSPVGPGAGAGVDANPSDVYIATDPGSLGPEEGDMEISFQAGGDDVPPEAPVDDEKQPPM